MCIFLRLPLLCIALSILTVSCHSSSDNDTAHTADTPSSPLASANNTTASHNPKEMPPGTSKWQTTLFQKALVKDTLSFVNDQYSKVLIKVTSLLDSGGNIRINQLIMPNSLTDGPFGREMAYPLDQKGVYRIIVGESQMQGDVFEGDYQISIELVK